MRVLLEGGNDTDLSVVAAALRRGGCHLAEAGGSYDFRLTLRSAAAPPPIQIDAVRSQAVMDSRSIRLTRIELAILTYLAGRDRPADRTALLAAIWGYRFDPGTNLVAVHISRLRAKLGPHILLGGPEGYRLAHATAPEAGVRVDRPKAAP